MSVERARRRIAYQTLLQDSLDPTPGPFELTSDDSPLFHQTIDDPSEIPGFSEETKTAMDESQHTQSVLPLPIPSGMYISQECMYVCTMLCVHVPTSWRSLSIAHTLARICMV